MIAYPHSPLVGNRYLIEDLLGEGGVGAVYRAKDRLTGNRVALKRLIDPSNAGLFASSGSATVTQVALAQEFQILASLRHPNIIGVLDYGFDEKRQPYYTMDLLVDAQDIRRAARIQRRDIQVGYLVQMLQALDYLHRRGIIHRDLKPANVLVKDDQVKVLDFGFATMANQAPIGTSGTLPYLAPEIFNQQPASVASDLYAVGVIAYEVFVGRHPYNTENVKALLDDLLYKTPDLSALGTSTPLAQVIGRLLAKEPLARYASAQHVIMALTAAIDQAPPPEDTAIRESFLQAAPLTGREQEVEMLTNALRDALEGKGSTWLIGGESGVGKSRLLAEIATLALIRGTLVLRGTAVQMGAQPYQLWLEPLRRLILATPMTDAEAGVLKELVPTVATLLDRPIPDVPPLESPSAQQSRLLTTILGVMRRQRQPIVIILDDVQWAGEESLGLLHQVNAVIEPRQILILANYRDDERPNLPQALPEMQMLKLQRLSIQHIASLSAAMLGENGRQPEITAYLERETEGNVFFLIEVVRALAEDAGQLRAIGSVELPAQLVVGGIQRIVERRIAHVPPQALPLLQAAAVFGRHLDLAVLAAIDGTTTLQNWLVDCANAAMLDVLNERWQFAHDKLREGVLTALSAERRRSLHTQVAEAIESIYPDDLGQAAALAYHWSMAGNTGKEAHYSRLAGEQALKISAGRDAVRYFERSLELTSDRHERAVITHRIAQALFWLGEFNESRTRNLDALAVAREYGDQDLAGKVLVLLGNTVIHQGEYVLAAEYHRESLAISRALHDSDTMSNSLAGLGDVAWRTGDYAQAMAYLQENLEVTQRLNKLTLMGSAYNMLGIVYGIQRQFAQSQEAFRQSLALAEQTGDRSRIAQALSNLGETSLMQEDYESARESFEQALESSREAGNRYSLGNIQVNLGLIAEATGNLEQARQYFVQVLENATQMGATTLILGAVGGLARLAVHRKEDVYALELMGMILYHPAASPDLQNMVTKDVFDELKARVPSDEYEAALERGKAFDLKATVESMLRLD